MNKHSRFSMIAASLMVSVLVLGTGVAFARDGQGGDSGSRESRTSVAEQNDDSTTSSTDQIKKEREVEHQEIEDTAEQKKEAVREKICENRKSRIDDRAKKINDRASDFTNKLNDKFTKLEKLIADKNLQVANYDALKADVIAKQQAVIKARGAISQTAQSFPCTGEQRSQRAAAIKAKVTEFQTAAKAYKDSLKALFTAVKTALLAQTQTSTSQEGTN